MDSLVRSFLPGLPAHTDTTLYRPSSTHQYRTYSAVVSPQLQQLRLVGEERCGRWRRACPADGQNHGFCSDCRRRAEQVCRRRPYCLGLTGAMRTPTPYHHIFRQIRCSH